MSLEEQIKKEEEELKKLQEQENSKEEENLEQDDEEESDDDFQEEESQTDDDGQDDEESVDDEEHDSDEDENKEGGSEENNLAAQLRIARKQKKQLEERLKSMQNPVQPDTKQNQNASEETKMTLEERFEKREREERAKELKNSAIEEFIETEQEFQKETPDYKQASSHMLARMIQGAKFSTPGISNRQAQEFARDQILQIAAQAAHNGLNPAEALYNIAYEHYGYNPELYKEEEGSNNDKKSQREKAQRETKRLEKINKNKKRSASSLAGGGQTRSNVVTSEEAANMDLASFSKLSEADMDSIINDS